MTRNLNNNYSEKLIEVKVHLVLIGSSDCNNKMKSSGFSNNKKAENKYILI